MGSAFNINKVYRFTAIMLTALFLLLQGASLSHAASYGSDPHEHEGVECVLHQQTETQAIVPTPVASPILPALLNSANPRPEVPHPSRIRPPHNALTFRATFFLLGLTS